MYQTLSEVGGFKKTANGFWWLTVVAQHDAQLRTIIYSHPELYNRPVLSKFCHDSGVWQAMSQAGGMAEHGGDTIKKVQVACAA